MYHFTSARLFRKCYKHQLIFNGFVYGSIGHKHRSHIYNAACGTRKCRYLSNTCAICAFLLTSPRRLQRGAIPAADPRSPTKGVNLAAGLGPDPIFAQYPIFLCVAATRTTTPATNPWCEIKPERMHCRIASGISCVHYVGGATKVMGISNVNFQHSPPRATKTITQQFVFQQFHTWRQKTITKQFHPHCDTRNYKTICFSTIPAPGRPKQLQNNLFFNNSTTMATKTITKQFVFQQFHQHGDKNNYKKNLFFNNSTNRATKTITKQIVFQQFNGRLKQLHNNTFFNKSTILVTKTITKQIVFQQFNTICDKNNYTTICFSTIPQPGRQKQLQNNLFSTFPYFVWRQKTITKQFCFQQFNKFGDKREYKTICFQQFNTPGDKNHYKTICFQIIQHTGRPKQLQTNLFFFNNSATLATNTITQQFVISTIPQPLRPKLLQNNLFFNNSTHFATKTITKHVVFSISSTKIATQAITKQFVFQFNKHCDQNIYKTNYFSTIPQTLRQKQYQNNLFFNNSTNIETKTITKQIVFQQFNKFCDKNNYKTNCASTVPHTLQLIQSKTLFSTIQHTGRPTQLQNNFVFNNSTNFATKSITNQIVFSTIQQIWRQKQLQRNLFFNNSTHRATTTITRRIFVQQFHKHCDASNCKTSFSTIQQSGRTKQLQNKLFFQQFHTFGDNNYKTICLSTIRHPGRQKAITK